MRLVLRPRPYPRTLSSDLRFSNASYNLKSILTYSFGESPSFNLKLIYDSSPTTKHTNPLRTDSALFPQSPATPCPSLNPYFLNSKIHIPFGILTSLHLT